MSRREKKQVHHVQMTEVVSRVLHKMVCRLCHE